jgi:hypothetical protein
LPIFQGSTIPPVCAAADDPGGGPVAGMVAKGWIEKQPDGRTYCITPAGDEALRAVIPVKR